MWKMFKFLKGIIKGILDLKEETQKLTGEYFITNATMDLIKEFESFSPTAYQDTVGVWTIGYGSTFYKDGTSVKAGDTITRLEAERLFKHVLDQFASEMDSVIKSDLTDCQFGALLSLTYNIGIEAFKSSTILKKINVDPDDPSIEVQFNRWVKAGGKTSNGLIKRRRKEVDFYFGKTCQ